MWEVEVFVVVNPITSVVVRLEAIPHL